MGGTVPPKGAGCGAAAGDIPVASAVDSLVMFFFFFSSQNGEKKKSAFLNDGMG